MAEYVLRTDVRVESGGIGCFETVPAGTVVELIEGFDLVRLPSGDNIHNRPGLLQEMEAKPKRGKGAGNGDEYRTDTRTTVE